MTSSVIITVVVVLAIIVAGGFLLYFCGDLLMGLAGKKKDADVVAEKQEKDRKELEDRVNALENSEEIKKDPDIAAILGEGAIIEAYNPDEEEEVEETVEETEEEPVDADETEDELVEEVEDAETEETAEEENAEENAEEVDEEEDEAAEFIRQRRAELMERLARMQQEQAKEEEAEEESVELEEAEETVEEEDTQSEEVAENEEANETEESAEPENSEVEEEAKEEEAVEEDDAQEEIAPAVVAIGPVANMTRGELEAKLADEQERLKENEKDLRQCKKEYIPLRRVKKTLENDEKKLRRKEALVAKQKVVLYGVNNYADIDEEKAKKLAEDLDLLDGLKLSVQHCQEVMEKNEERYPLLEKIFNLLSAQNEEIKADIKELQDALAKLQDVPTDSDSDAE